MLATGKVNNMAKRYLNIKQLESMKKVDLQELAKKLGVSDDGTVKELAARIAEVEVDIPEESQQQEEEKPPTEQAAKEDAETEAAKENKPAQSERTQEPEKTEEKAAAGQIKVKAITRYLDKQFNEIKETGEEFTVSAERAAVLVNAKVAEIIK